MKLFCRTSYILAVIGLTYCSPEPIKSNQVSQLLGRWNSYELGDQQTGFTPGVTTSLTVRYESGITFSKDGTFRCRYFDFGSGAWSETSEPIGNFEVKGESIVLTFFSDADNDVQLDLKVVKLDVNHLWFKHSYFGFEQEHHLERVD